MIVGKWILPYLNFLGRQSLINEDIIKNGCTTKTYHVHCWGDFGRLRTKLTESWH